MSNRQGALIQFFICCVVVTLSTNCHALTSIATIEGHVLDAWWRSSGYASQKEADQVALEGCRKEARKNKIGHLAKNCATVARAKAPGFGAVTCGDDGCAWSLGNTDSQEAVDRAYAYCKKTFANCKSENIGFWEDTTGFARKPDVQAAKTNGNCRPRTTRIRCQSSCTNGDCVVTYENGCKIRVRVSPQFNPFNSQWEYPSPSC